MPRGPATALVLVTCMTTHASAELPRDVALALVEVDDTPTPWLLRTVDCLDAATRVEGPFVPFECLPPASATIGFSVMIGEVASFESDRDPGCGETLPRWLERRVPGRARASHRVGIRQDDDAPIGPALDRAWRETVALVTLGFVSPAIAWVAEARVTSGPRTTRPAVALGSPLEGWVLHLDDVAGAVVLIGPDGREERLAPLPRTGRGAASIWEVAVSPDARWIVLRVAAIEGTPCDPAELHRLELEVPERVRVRSFGRRVRWSGDERRCLADHERSACEARCEDRSDRCAEVARIVEAADPDAAIVLYERACTGGDGLACEAQVRLRPPGEIAVKGGTPPWVRSWQQRIRDALVTRCEADTLEACEALVARRAAAAWWRPTLAEARRARDRALRILDAACARNDDVCPARAAMRARRVR